MTTENRARHAEAGDRSTRLRRRGASVLAGVAVLAAACVAPPPIPLKTEIPLEPVVIDLPAFDVDLGFCTARVDLPTVEIDNLVLRIPEMNLDAEKGTVSLPSVTLTADARTIVTDGIEAVCAPFDPFVVDLAVTLPAIYVGGAITLDFDRQLLIVDDLLLEISGGQIVVGGPDGLTIPLPEVSNRLDGLTVPL